MNGSTANELTSIRLSMSDLKTAEKVCMLSLGSLGVVDTFDHISAGLRSACGTKLCTNECLASSQVEVGGIEFNQCQRTVSSGSKAFESHSIFAASSVTLLDLHSRSYTLNQSNPDCFPCVLNFAESNLGLAALRGGDDIVVVKGCL